MALANRISTRLRGPWKGAFHRAFPARQILIRDSVRVRCLTVGPFHQLALLSGLAALVLWCLLSSAAYLQAGVTMAAHQDDVARRTAELENTKKSYEAVFQQVDDFQTVFGNAACEISNIQNSLVRLAERSVQQGKRGAPPPSLPQLEADAGGCRVSARTASATDGMNGEQDAIRLRILRLEASLEQLRASHGAFLSRTANVASARIGQLERALKSVGIDTKTLANAAPAEESVRPRFGRGGPFVAAVNTAHPYSDAIPVALFNTRATRLDRLTSVVRALPLSEPLEDYEVTSPFGARNDPINFMTGIHEGVDLGAPEGTPVAATGEGVVVWAGPRDRYGNLVEIDHGMGLHTRYAHLGRVLVRVDQKIARGTPIGLLGSTGRSTGPHLHYEVRVNDQATNPMKFIMAGRDVLKGQ